MISQRRRKARAARARAVLRNCLLQINARLVNRSRVVPTLLVLLIALFSQSLIQALTPAGAVIRNQATATYLDSASQAQSTSSNEVQTLVQEVIGLQLVQSQSKLANSGSTVFFAHFLTNTGNGTEPYTVCLDQSAFPDDEVSEHYDFTSLELFADANEDGLPDTPGTPLDIEPTTPTGASGSAVCYAISALNAGQAVQIVVAAATPTGETSGNVGTYSIQAFANNDNTINVTNTDDVTITTNPTIDVVKAMDIDTGPKGTSPVTITLTYRNTGTLDATDLEIVEILPTQAEINGNLGGMTYIANSASWTEDSAGATLALLTDTDVVAQADSGFDVVYCAYDASCTPSPYGDDRIAFLVNDIPAGSEGTIVFQVEIDDVATLEDGDILLNDVLYQYYDSSGTILVDNNGNPFESNAVTFVVEEDSVNPAVVANDTGTGGGETLGVDDALDTNNIVYTTNYDGFDLTSNSIPQGGTAIFENYIWNTGDGVDTFDIEIDNVYGRDGTPIANPFPAGTTFTLLKSDGVSPLLDTNGNSDADTGPMNPGEVFKVVLEVTPPIATTGDNGGFGWEVTKVARSTVDTGISNAVTDFLSVIETSEIDLTNSQTRVDDPGDGSSCINDDPPNALCNGEGDGPKSVAANDYMVATGASVSIPLWAHNIGGAGDAFDLSVSDSNSPFSAGQLPTGISIAFYEVGGGSDCSVLGSQITNTGTVAGGSALLACALITVDSSVVADDEYIDLYFRAQSPTTGEADIKYDRLLVIAAPAIEITPNHTGQVSPGQFIVYPHTVTNTGNTNLECISITPTDDLVANGWTSQVYLDVNSDGLFDSGDQVYSDQTLIPGGSFSILVRIFAPASEGDGTVNNTNLQVDSFIDDNDGNPATCGGATTAEDSADDVTTVVDSDIVIVKRQAPDDDCDGVADSAFVTTTFYVDPSLCAVYELTTTNMGAETMYELTVSDLTPAYTSYRANAQACEYIDISSPPSIDCSIGVVPASAPYEAEPTDGGSGIVQWYIPALIPGATIVANFGIRVD